MLLIGRLRRLKKNPSMVLFKKHNGKFDASGIYASDTIYDIKIVN